MMAFLKSTLRFVYLFQSAQSFVHNVIRVPDDSRISVSLSSSNEDGRVVSFLLDSKHHNDWHRYCENVDKNLEGLVSPSPESFSAIHSAMLRANAAISTNIEDILALSRYLVKPNYTMELFHDDEIIKWRMIQGGSVEGVIVDSNIAVEEGGRELYHEFSTLQLSQMALEIATNTTNHDANLLSKIHEVAQQAEKRIFLTVGSDLRGPQSADACFNFALAGVHNSSTHLFQNLVSIGTHELKRAGSRSSFPTKSVLHIVEKFAASDIRKEDAMELYQIAADCLEKKRYKDKMYIESLRDGTFGFHGRPLLWLWRFSSRQKKVEIDNEGNGKGKDAINWQDEFQDTNKPLVVDIGSGMGTCILGLASTSANIHDKLPIEWSQCNYAGVDLNQALVRFGNGIASRWPDARKGRVKFFCCPADDFLSNLKSYHGRSTLIMVNFPSPYRLDASERGNLQLPSAENFMVTSKLFELISVLAANDTNERYFMFQTKCEDVAVYLKNECLSNGMEGITAGYKAVENIDNIYSQKSVPKRVKEWLRIEPLAERAEGNLFWSQPILPLDCLPETEVQCLSENKAVHRCLLKYKNT